jgi:hypothetical protein
LVFGLTYKFVWKLGARLRLEGFDINQVIKDSQAKSQGN